MPHGNCPKQARCGSKLQLLQVHAACILLLIMGTSACRDGASGNPVALGTCTCVRSRYDLVRDRLEIGHPTDGEIKAASTKRGVDDLILMRVVVPRLCLTINKLAFRIALRSASKMPCPTLGEVLQVLRSPPYEYCLHYLTVRYLTFAAVTPYKVGIPSVPAENEPPLTAS